MDIQYINPIMGRGRGIFFVPDLDLRLFERHNHYNFTASTELKLCVYIHADLQKIEYYTVSEEKVVFSYKESRNKKPICGSIYMLPNLCPSPNLYIYSFVILT